MRKIPVFYHIPKNAGTYVSDWLLLGLRWYQEKYTNWLQYLTPEVCIQKRIIKVLRINNDTHPQPIARILIGDPEFLIESSDIFSKNSLQDKTTWNINSINIDKNLLKKFFIFGVIIESNGFTEKDDILELFNDYDFHQFLILREAFSRTQSMYHYLESDNSSHEATHNQYGGKSFNECVVGNLIEDSWLIRSFLKLKDNEVITEEHFDKTLKLLESFNVYNMSRVDESINDALSECYSFDMRDIKIEGRFEKNENQYKKISFDSLPENVQEKFLERTFWDKKLYEHFK